VRDTQGTILGRHLDSVKAAEQRFFDDMRAQKKYEQETRFYQVRACWGGGQGRAKPQFLCR
jgi:hypothetical protein